MQIILTVRSTTVKDGSPCTHATLALMKVLLHHVQRLGVQTVQWCGKRKVKRLMPKGSLAELQTQFHNYFSFSSYFGFQPVHTTSTTVVVKISPDYWELGYRLNSDLDSCTPILLFRILYLSSGTSINHTSSIFLHPTIIINIIIHHYSKCIEAFKAVQASKIISARVRLSPSANAHDGRSRPVLIQHRRFASFPPISCPRQEPACVTSNSSILNPFNIFSFFTLPRKGSVNCSLYIHLDLLSQHPHLSVLLGKPSVSTSIPTAPP